MQIIGALIALIITLIVLGVIFWAVRELLALIPMGEPFATLVRVLLILVGVLIVIYVLLYLLSMIGIPVPMFHAMR